MRTSKKLLSLFLAVVMVITSCSVGLTAFAADGNQTDKNQTYWNDATEADEAFDAINDLIGSLLQLDAIKNALNGVGVTDTSSLSKVIEGLSPFLLSKIGGNVSKSKWLSDHYTGYSSDAYNYNQAFAIVDGDGDDAFSFYTLYNFCEENKDSDNSELKAYCRNTLTELDKLKEKCEKRLKLISNSETKINEIFENAIIPELSGEYKTRKLTSGGFKAAAPLNLLKEAKYNDKLLADYTVDDMRELLGEDDYYLDYYINAFKKIGLDGEIDSLAKLVFYTSMDNGKVVFESLVLLYLLNQSGQTVTLTNGSNTTPALTPQNVRTEVDNLFTARTFYTTYSPSTKLGNTFKTASYRIDKYIAAGTDTFAYTYAPLAVLLDGNGLGLDSYTSYKMNGGINNSMALKSNYKKIVDQLAKEDGITDSALDEAKMTDAQIQAVIDYATANNWDSVDISTFKSFLQSEDNKFSAPVTRYFLTLADATNTADLKGLQQTFNANSSKPGAGTVAAIRNYILNDGNEYLQGLTLEQRVNTMLSTEAIFDKAGDDKAEAYTLPSTVCTALDTINIAKYFASEIANKKDVQNEYNYAGDLVIPNSLTVYAVNAILNSYIAYVEYPELKNIIQSILGPDVDLGAVLRNIWLNLYNHPVETVFNILPTLLSVIDGLVPILFHDDIDDVTAIETAGLPTLEKLLMSPKGDPNGIAGFLDTIGAAFGADLSGVANVVNLYPYSQRAGNTDIGLGALHIDLNKALPAILHYLNGDIPTAVGIVGTYAGVTADDGSQPYNAQVIRFTNIYIVDGLITQSQTPEGLIKGIAGLLKKEVNLDKGVVEIINELFKDLMNAVDPSIDTSEKRYMSGVERQDGINNIMVGLPKIIDNLGKNFITEHNVDSNWAFAYDSTSGASTKKIDTDASIGTYNTHVQAFKDLAPEDNTKMTAANAAKILEQFVDLLIGNWINALLDFLNDTLMDPNNEITSELPLVQGLVEAIGGFGDKSILTDALNGLFQLKRCDDATFTLTKRDKTGFVGLSNTTGFFLISNIQFVKAGEIRGLIPFIQGITKPGSTKANYNLKKAFSGVPLLAASSKNKSAAGTDYDKLLTKENKQAAQKLIDTLDEILSSLLKNTSLNGFDWTSNENLLSSLVTFASTFFGEQNTNDIVKLLNNYLYFVVGESKKTPSTDGNIGTKPQGGNVDKNKVYTSANLSNLVIQTYSLLENIIDYLFYNSQTGVLNKQDPNMLIADALYGIISPDAVGVRLSDDYSKTAEVLAKKDFRNWNSFKVDITAANNNLKEYNAKDYLKFGFAKGDKNAFYDALGESLNGVAGILGAVLTKSYIDKSKSGNLYSELLYPILSSIANATGASGVMSPSAFNSATAPQQLIKGIITPLSNILSQIYPAPVTMLLNTIKGLGNILKDENISKIVGSVFATLNLHIDGLGNILDKDITNLSPTYAAKIRDSLGGKINIQLPSKNIAVGILNKLLSGTLKFSLPNINWDKLANAESPAEVLLLVYGYVVDTLLGSDLLTSLIDSLDPSISKVLKNLSAAQILDVLAQIIKVVQSPTEVYWTFSMYAAKLTNSFVYPKGITKDKADDAVKQLDQLVENLFPLLNGLGVTDIEDLNSIINDKLYTNENITAIAKALYGALTGNSTVVAVLKALNLDVTPQGVAKYLTDKSYGKTYTSAAKTLKKAKSWDKVKKLNWGYKNGSSNAQTGFINGLAASLRPLNKILAVFLAEGTLDLSKVQIKNAIKALSLSGSTVLKANKAEYNTKLTYKIDKGILTLTFQTAVKTVNNKNNTKSVLKIDIDAIAGDIENMLKDKKLNFGTNGYENAVIPLLEAFMIKDLKTYKQYKADYKKAKDNLLINILKPIGKFLTKLADKPFDTLTSIIPNIAYFIDSNGLAQAVANLLAPITSKNGIMGVLKKNGIDIDKLVKSITGKSLGRVVADLVGYKGKLTLSLTDLKKSNIQVIIVPLLNNLVLNKWNIKLPTIDWAKLASHGKIKVVKSAARNDKGKFTTRQVIARKGETLVAVLRYIADTLIKNAKAIKKLLVGIDAIKKNKTIKSVVESVLDQISTAKKDDIVLALFYLLVGEPSDKFFDYRGFEYKSYDFNWGDLDEDFCRQLAPMLDGLIGGLLEGGLEGLVKDKLYTDEIVGKLTTGLYGAIEGVKISDKIGTLTDILAMTDIDMTTTGVAKVLTDKDYGKQYPAVARAIRGKSWKNVKAEDLKFGVKDRDSFLHALTAALRPLFGVLDVLLNDASLNLFNLASIPGSDDYSSTIVPLLEAFGVYNIKTQYQYREDIYNEYDSILLDILNPLWDKVEDILNAPIETLGNILPNLALFFANGGLTQVIDNLLEPISALLRALRPIVDVNDLLKALNLDVPKLLKDKVGLSIKKFDLYDLQGTLNPVIGADNIVGTLNAVLKIIKIKGKPLGLELPDINWFKLASCGEYNLNATSQAATLGSRISVKPDEDQAFITVLRFLIETINYKGNYDKIVALVGGLIGDDNDTVAGVVDQVFGLLQGDTDQVIKDLVDLLQQLAG